MARTADTTHGGGPSLPRLDSQGRFETALPLVLAASPNPWDRYHVFLEGPATSSLVSPAPALGRVGLGMGGRREGVVRNLLLAMPRGQGLPKVRSMFLVSPYNAGPMQCLLILIPTHPLLSNNGVEVGPRRPSRTVGQPKTNARMPHRE